MVQKIGIIGAGQMGNGIAHVCAQSGFEVVLSDISEEQLANALKTIEKNMDRQIKKEKITAEDKDKALANITTSTDINSLSGCELVVEAASENEAIKKSIFEKLIEVVGKDTIIATNTSSISITRLASMTDRPEKFIGMHFMNPVPMMKLVEIICGIATSNETYEIIKELTEKLGKTPVRAEDSPAFIINRILLPMINEAIYTLYEGVGKVTDIDNAMMLGAAHPMGPLALADFIGLDTCLAIMRVMYDGLGDSKYRPCPLLIKYVEAGWLGRKTKRGFYDYNGEEPIPTR